MTNKPIIVQRSVTGDCRNPCCEYTFTREGNGLIVAYDSHGYRFEPIVSHHVV